MTQDNQHLNFDDLDTSDTYDKSEAAKGGTFDDVPDGKYQCIVDKVWLTMSKGGVGNPPKRMLRWQLKIVTGQHSGRIVFHNNMIETPENVKWLKGDLEVCGLKIAKLAELNDRSQSLVGVGLEVQVKNRGKDPQGRSNVNTYLNKAIEIDRSAAQAVPASGGQGGDGVAPVAGSADDEEIPF